MPIKSRNSCRVGAMVVVRGDLLALDPPFESLAIRSNQNQPSVSRTMLLSGQVMPQNGGPVGVLLHVCDVELRGIG
jgi:hypothetical protein